MPTPASVLDDTSIDATDTVTLIVTRKRASHLQSILTEYINAILLSAIECDGYGGKTRQPSSAAADLCRQWADYAADIRSQLATLLDS